MTAKPDRRAAKQIAQERIEILLDQAMKTIHEDSAFAQRYVEIARKIGMRHKVRIPRRRKLFLCRRCKKLIIPGLNCRVRIQQRREPHVAITCMECGHTKRLLLRRGKRPSTWKEQPQPAR